MVLNCPSEEFPGREIKSKCHKSIQYTRDATCETNFNIHNCSDIGVWYFMSGKLPSFYELGLPSGSVPSVLNRHDMILWVSHPCNSSWTYFVEIKQETGSKQGEVLHCVLPCLFCTTIIFFQREQARVDLSYNENKLCVYNSMLFQ